MGENVTVFGDIADDFDALVAYDEQLLDSWVEESGYSIGSMAVASTAIAFMRVAQGFTDVGRLGNGLFLEGGWRGAGKDLLRGLTFVGGSGAVAGRARGVMLVRQAAGTNTCVPIAFTNALRLSGQRFVIGLKDFAARAGINLAQVSRSGSSTADYAQMLGGLRAMGVPTRVLAQGVERPLSQLPAILRANPGGVATVSIRYAQAGAEYGHRVVATFSRSGGLVVRDPTGAVYRSVAELARVFGPHARIGAREIVFIPNSVIVSAARTVQQVAGPVLGARISEAGVQDLLASIALHVVPVVGVRAGDAETAAQALAAAEPDPAVRQVPRAVIAAGADAAGGEWHTVARGDNLSALAQRHYGSRLKWPVIYAANRRTIGADPNRIEPGQRLRIPPLPAVRRRPGGARAA